MISKLVQKIKENGILLTILTIGRKTINLLFRYIILRNSKMNFDYTAKIEGLRNIYVSKKVFAGKYFWIAAYEDYMGQKYNPRIVFKGAFVASEFCHIGATNYIEIGNNVLFGSKVYVTDHGHGVYSGDGIHSLPYEPPVYRELNSDKQVIIGDNVWIGDNVTILPDVYIGNGSVIGSNSVVTKDIPECSVAVGVPARVIKKFNKNINRWE